MLHWQALMVSFDAKIIALYIKVDAGTKSHEIPLWPSGCPLQNSSSFLWNWEFRVGAAGFAKRPQTCPKR